MSDVLLIAAFPSEEKLHAALGELHGRRGIALDAYGPLPSERIAALLGATDRTVIHAALIGGLAAAGATYAMEYVSSVWLFSFLVGGKPFNSWPPFAVVSFAMGLLGAVLGAFGAMLAKNGLPRLHHPVFDHLSCAGDEWFLTLHADEEDDIPALREIIARQEPLSIREAAP